ncbi:MAG: hypothetical protein HY651_09045 [Acidobacteria bacterium]|nr:hypothetical protein [Acidobacteriota bacterium]
MSTQINSASEQACHLNSNSAEPTVIDHVAEFIERFVFLPDRRLYGLIAPWIVGTHLKSSLEYYGYLFIYSPERRCGKSRLLEVLQELTWNSSGVLVSPSPAALFRTASSMTQLLDEVDGWTNKDELRSLLNAGFHEGGLIPRADTPTPGGGYTVKAYDAYGPKALAGIGLRILDETTRDRTFIVQMVRQKPNERRERFTRKEKRDA